VDQFTVDDLYRILRECAGEPEYGRDAGATVETSFAELGYDSLAVLEASTRVSREYGVSLPDGDVSNLETPGEFASAVNRLLGGRA
jgi:act minimal PKS acyl carrier protein